MSKNIGMEQDWHQSMSRHLDDFPSIPGYYLSSAGFPADWKSVSAGLDAFTFLWSESANRAVVVVPQNQNSVFLSLCASKSFSVTKIGTVDSSLTSIELEGAFGETISLNITELQVISEETLPRFFG